MTTLQLTELIPMETPCGPGYAILVDSCEYENYWTVALENGALVTFPQGKVRVSRNYTHRRGINDEQMRDIVNVKLDEDSV